MISWFIIYLIVSIFQYVEDYKLVALFEGALVMAAKILYILILNEFMIGKTRKVLAHIIFQTYVIIRTS